MYFLVELYSRKSTVEFSKLNKHASLKINE